MQAPVPSPSHPASHSRRRWTTRSLTEFLILVYALCAVSLYACALPLWEGWDEPFHYGYVETIALQHRFPVLQQSTLTQEIATSLQLTPLSRLLTKYVDESISFEDWHKWNAAQRSEMRARLDGVAPSLRFLPGRQANYEAQQAPLAYLLVAPLDALTGRLQLVQRILALRIVEASAAMVLLFWSLRALAVSFGIPDAFRNGLLLCALSIQVIWAAVSHVGNDALAIPLTVAFLAFLTDKRRLSWLAVVLAAGLLTKAYFLSFLPVFAIALAYRLVRRETTLSTVALSCGLVAVTAAPWYVRNVRLYGTVSGTQESAAGIGVAKALTAVPHIPWFKSLLSFFRSSLWSGDWSFTAYSRGTLAVEQLLLLAGFVLYLRHRDRMRRSEWLLWTACAFFGAGLVYQTCVTWVQSHGESVVPEPWYWQGVATCLFTFVFAGFARSGAWGRICAIAICLVAAWIAFSTFWLKMLPGYGGGIGRSTAPAVIKWWTSHPASDLYVASLAPAPVIFALLALFTASLGTAVWKITSAISTYSRSR